MAHGHRQGAVGARVRGQPVVGELGRVRVVRAHHDDLLAAVAGLGHPVRVRGAGHRDVRAPEDQVGGVPPVAGLRDVGLVAEHLRRGDGQVGVPVVEREHRRADQRHEPRTGRVRHHRHRRDRREAGDPVRPVLLDRVHVGRSDHLRRLVPGRADEPALAPLGLVGARPLRVVDDVRPGQHRVAEPGLRLAVHRQQRAAHVGVAHPGRRVGVPGESGAPGAAAGLVLGTVGAGRRIVRLLRLPRDDPVLDVDLPRAGARAVHPVRGPDDLVVRPAVPVEAVGVAAPDLVQRAQVVADLALAEEPRGLDQRLGEAAVEAGLPVGGLPAVFRCERHSSPSRSCASCSRPGRLPDCSTPTTGRSDIP